jgi:MinD-like ATPase involved in chromosome partitioning or flagellar assembly
MKKILIISKKDNLKKEIEKSGFFDRVDIKNNFNPNSINIYDILIVDSESITYEKYLNSIPVILKNVESNYFISNSEDIYNNSNRTLGSYGIIVIPPHLTESQISQRICTLSVEGFKGKNNIVSFFGSGPCVGTTMISQSVAEAISKHTDKKVIYLSLDGDEAMGYFDINTNGAGLNTIKEKLINNLLTLEEFNLSCIKNESLYMLPGESDIKSIRYYHPEHIEKLIEFSKESFDIVIINAGSSVNGMSIGSLNSCDTRFLITTQSIKNEIYFRKILEQVFKNIGINEEDFLLIINKYIDHSDYKDAIEVSKTYSIPLVSVIPLVDYSISFFAEYKKDSLYERDISFKNSINQLSISICKEIGIEFKFDEVKSKKGFLGRFK